MRFVQSVLLIFSGIIAITLAIDRVNVDHLYYDMEIFQRNMDSSYDKYFVDVSKSNGGKSHEFLSNNSQAAEAVNPGFEFPFYGHMIKKFFVTTHGFLSFAPRLHNYMYKTQYIAPLRVKLDPSLSSYSTIDYLAQDDRVTIQWTNITVAEPYQHPLGGNFTFQATLHKNGDVVFVYIQIPELLTSDALYEKEPVAGLSDAFLISNNELHVYHTVNVEPRLINTKTVVVFTAKPTCIQQKTCGDCIQMAKESSFKCAWCPTLQQCSDGADRLREHWLDNGCSMNNISSNSNQCVSHTEWRTGVAVDHPTTNEVYRVKKENTQDNLVMIISIVVSTIMIFLLIGLVLSFIYLYGRNNPGSFAERVSMRMEKNYKRFGGMDLKHPKDLSEVEMSSPTQQQQNNNDQDLKQIVNNNSITVSF